MSEQRLTSILRWTGTVFTILFCLAPFVYMGLTGVSERPDYLSPDHEFRFTLGHVETVLRSETLHFPAYLRNSVIVSGITAVVVVFISALAAYAFTRLPIPGKAFILMAVLALSMFPPISLLSYLFKFMSALGWVNTYQGLVLPYVAWTLPLSLWILVSYFAQIPKDLDRAGLIDGCSRFQILTRIIMPVAAPGVFSTMLLAFVFAFNEFLFALMLTTDHEARTVPVGIALFEGLHGQIPWGQIMAAATVTTIPVVVLTLIFQRRVIQGLTQGAVKA